MEKINPTFEALLDMFVPEEKQDRALELLNEYGKIPEVYWDEILCGPHIVDSKNPDRTCDCGECDGYGTLKTQTGYRRCPNAYTHRNRQHVARSLAKIDQELVTWEGYPPPPLSDECWKSTDHYNAILNMRDQITNGERPKALILAGNHGCGKTAPALALVREITKLGHSCCVLHFPELVEMVRKYEDRKKFDRIIKRMEVCTLVVIDELGSETIYGNVQFIHETTDRIVKICYQKRYLIFTTNVKKEDLKNLVDGYVFDRLKKKTGYCTTVANFNIESQRDNLIF